MRHNTSHMPALPFVGVIALVAGCTPMAGPPLTSNDLAAPSTTASIAGADATASPAHAHSSSGLLFACGSRGLDRNATLQSLRTTFGAANVSKPEVEEGFTHVWLYPKDPRRTLSITIGPEASSFEAVADQPGSLWLLNGKLRIGDDLDTVKRLSGADFVRTSHDTRMYEGSFDPKCHYWFEVSHSASGAGASAARITRMGIRPLMVPAH